MKAIHSNNGITSLQVGIAILLAFILLSILFFFLRRENSNWLETRLERLNKKIGMVQAMRSEVFASAEAEKSAVMADTDEASKEFAEQSLQASQRVEKMRIELGTLIEKNGKESKLLDDLSACWERLQGIDREILSLAVQNTNIKASRLSFVPAAAALRDMEKALEQPMDSAASYPDAAAVIRLASKALTGALNIYALQAPHIAETSDAGMDQIEAKMKRLDEQVQDALSRLDGLVADPGKSLIDEARKSYREFQTTNAEIIGLSRRNSNIRSLAVSLGQKRSTMAQCMDSLNALEEAIRENATFKATK